MSQRRRRRYTLLPGKPARFLAAVAGLLLTLFLTLTVVCLLSGRWLTSEALHERIATDGQVVTAQMEAIRGKVELLAEEYGFDPQPVMDQITPEKMREADRAYSRWMTGAIREGKLQDAPVIQMDGIAEALQADAAFVAAQNSYMLKNTIRQINAEVEKSVSEEAMLFREALLRAAERTVSKAVSLTTLIAVIREVPLLLALAAGALTGLIALLMSRKLKLSLRYIGAAMSACALLLLLILVATRFLDLQALLREISATAARKYQLLAGTVAAETGIAAGLLLIFGGIANRVGRSGIR